MNTQTPRLNEDSSSPSSDEKMDTGTESLHSTQATPISNLSPDEDQDPSLTLDNILRLQSPQVLRLSEPDLNDSLISNISNLQINSPDNNRPKHFFASPKSSTLISTTDHPLMVLSSPDGYYPDLIPKHKDVKDVKNLSLSCIEDERETNGFYSPQRNTSKNNLYFNESFITAESHISSSTIDFLSSPPDIARGIEKRGIRNATDVSAIQEFHTGIADWVESPSQLRSIPNFELPIELKTNIPKLDLDSPDVLSQEDRSAYEALLDPYTGSVALRHTPRSPGPPRRKIQLPLEDDRSSLDSASVHSLESEDEPPEPAPLGSVASDDQTRRSTNTISECSEPIPEYSAAEELREERSWLTVPRAGQLVTCDMKVIEPYKRVVSHGGYDASGAALIVFSACHLPDVARCDYHYVMDNLFLYVIWTLERLVTDDYILIYLYGSAGPRRLPTIHWLREYYKLIDRRLRKSLKHLYVVHPTYGLKLFVAFTKAFVSSKFFRKLSYVRNLSELMELVPVEPNAIPELVKQYDAGKR